MMVTILGPTATGKTTLAAQLAYHINGEVISADSRQVYKGMTIGTGKDLNDYIVNNTQISYHLIDIVDAGYEYNLFEFVRDFHKAYKSVVVKGKTPVMCGGTGMYIESILKGYKMNEVSADENIRKLLNQKSNEELIRILSEKRKLHNITDTKDRSRLVKAVEICLTEENATYTYGKTDSIIFGIYFDRETIRKRITERLLQRLQSGMIEEVRILIDKGIPIEKLRYYGLEYRYIAQHISGEINYDNMYQGLNTAIHQFAKKQMTWFRKMEREGFKINWIDGNLPTAKKIEIIKNII